MEQNNIIAFSFWFELDRFQLSNCYTIIRKYKIKSSNFCPSMSYLHYLDDEYLKLQDFIRAISNTPVLDPSKLRVFH